MLSVVAFVVYVSAAKLRTLKLFRTCNFGFVPTDTPVLLRRYFATDNWNILDTASVLCVLVAFIFRLIAYAKDLYTEDNIFNNAFTQQASMTWVAVLDFCPFSLPEKSPQARILSTHSPGGSCCGCFYAAKCVANTPVREECATKSNLFDQGVPPPRRTYMDYFSTTVLTGDSFVQKPEEPHTTATGCAAPHTTRFTPRVQFLGQFESSLSTHAGVPSLRPPPPPR